MKQIKNFIAAAFLIISFCACSAVKDTPPPAVTPKHPYVAPALTQDGAWTMVLVPDTQVYTKFARNHGMLTSMYGWISENVEKLKIQQVVHLGDMVDQNRCVFRFPGQDNLTGPQQWNVISQMHKYLDGIVPYIVATGNHDYGETCAQDRHSLLDKYFVPERNSKLQNIIAFQGPNAFGIPNMENAAYQFTTPNGKKVLIISLAFSPTDKQIEWAKWVFSLKGYEDHFGILVTHAYLNTKGRIAKQNYMIDKDGNNGEQIFQKLVKECPNIRLVLCGHVSKANDWRGCVHFQSSKNKAGKTVHEMLFNPQALVGGWNGNGGDGWIRLLEFSKDMKKVKVRTFSPHFAISPSTQKLAWHTAPFNEFVFEYND